MASFIAVKISGEVPLYLAAVMGLISDFIQIPNSGPISGKTNSIIGGLSHFIL